MVVNKELLIRIAIFAAGSGLGALAAWKILADKYEAETRAQVQEVKDYYNKKEQEREDAYIVFNNRAEVGDALDIPTFADPLDPTPEEEDAAFRKAELEDYRQKTQKYTGTQVSDPDYEDAQVAKYTKAFTNVEGPIFIISRELFYSQEDDFDKESLQYYDEDNVLVNFAGDVIREPMEVVGDEWYDLFIKDGPTRSIWVRNERLKVDYEIDLNEGSYVELVLGILPEKGDVLKFRDND